MHVSLSGEFDFKLLAAGPLLQDVPKGVDVISYARDGQGMSIRIFSRFTPKALPRTPEIFLAPLPFGILLSIRVIPIKNKGK